MAPQKSILIAHMSTQAHRSARAALLKSRRVNTELNMAWLLAHQTSLFKTCIDLQDLIRSVCHDVEHEAANSMDHTKCAAIITNIFYPMCRDRLRNDVAGEEFSLIIDEAIDHTYLGIVLKYFSKSKQRVTGALLKLQSVDSGDVDGVLCAIKTAVETEFGLNLQHCIGIATDCGGVRREIKRELPHIVLLPCVSHSLLTAISEACQVLPGKLEQLVSETFYWFDEYCCDRNRRYRYASIYKALTDGHDAEHIKKARCEPHFMSIESAVSRILAMWSQLSAHFESVHNEERSWDTERLRDLYAKPELKSYLICIMPHLRAVQRVNRLFKCDEQQVVDTSLIVDKLCLLIAKTANGITEGKRGADFDPLLSNVEECVAPNPDLGSDFETCIATQLANKSITHELAADIRRSCIAFIVQLVYALRKRLPDDVAAWRRLANISVARALAVERPKLGEMLEFTVKYTPATVAKIEMQWQRLPTIRWTQKKVTTKFWAEVHSYTDGAGNAPYAELANFARRMLVLPFTDAHDERTFRRTNIVANELRNRVEGRFFNALLMVWSSDTSLELDTTDDMLQRYDAIATGAYSYEGYNQEIVDLFEEDNFVTEE